ncbi:MAG: hypothetical protein IJZ23_05005 [Roseburia sp.]|nr:hypothetical protein [Roseburia sp.]
MLGKLFKHEFKSTYKVMCLIYAIMVIVTLLGMAVFKMCDIANDATPTSMVILAMVYLVIYIISLFAFMIISYVYLAMHFYKSMYSAQGYLTHTLPVKTLTTFHVKAAVSVIWLLLVNVLTYLSAFGLIYSLLDPMLWRAFLPELLPEIETVFVSMYGLSMGEFAVIMIISNLLSPILTIMMIALACSIGQLFNRQKVAASIVAGIILYFINQVIGNALTMSTMISADMSDVTYLADTYGPTIWLSLAVSAGFTLICYIGSNIIIRKHINLE